MSSSQTMLALVAGAVLLYVSQEGNRSTYEVASEQTPLAQAARAGDLGLVEQASANGADVNYQDSLMGNTPLHWAVAMESEQSRPNQNRLAIVQALLRKGADPRRLNLGDETPLYRAVWNPDLVEALLKGGAEVDAGLGARTPLISATYFGVGSYCFPATEAMKVLIKAGANVNAGESGSKWTALSTAAIYGCPEMVELLLSAGADPNGETVLGETILGTVKRSEKIDNENPMGFLTRPNPLVRKRNVELIRKAGGHE